MTQPLREGIAVWPGDPPYGAEELSSVQAGDAFRVSRLAMGSHTGTHVDAPAHALRDGAGVDALPLEVLWGPASLRALGGERVIGARALASLALPEDCRRLLLCTGDTRGDEVGAQGFDPTFAALDAAAAGWLVARGVVLVGIDSPSVEPFGEAMGPVHRVLLAAGVVIVEGLALGGVPAGEYEFVCLPIKVRGGDGAPARALLRG